MDKKSPLGEPTTYTEIYTPDLLFPIPRALSRDKLQLSKNFIFEGEDIWNGYEISWLNLKGKPEITLAAFYIPCSSPYIIESKSFKLYLNSFNQSRFDSLEQVRELMQTDLSIAASAKVRVNFIKPDHSTFKEFPGICLDSIDISINNYEMNPQFLITHKEKVKEYLYSNLLKSNCLVTGQPDWGSLFIHYEGQKIDHAGLLKYIISFRKHSGFAEHCVEQIYSDILTGCRPEKLTVYARYTRRGGLDINPFRSNFENEISNFRLYRQ